MPSTANIWKPNPKQELFLSIPTTIKEGFYGGGAGSGKSDVLLMYGLVHKWHEHPQFKQVFMRRTHADLKKEIVPRSREIYPRFGAKFNGTDMVWTFPRPDQFGATAYNPQGAMIFLGHCEHEKDVHMYDSMEISLFTPDELTLYTEWIYLYITFERNRAPKGSGLPSITRAAGMPGGIGHKFVNTRFVKPYKPGGVILEGKGGNKRIFIRATLEDNKDHIDPTYAQSLEGLPEAEKRAKKYGDFDAYIGQVFDELRKKRYPDEPDNALHSCQPFDIPSWWPKLLIGDWGYTAMCYWGFYAISPQKRVYLYRELCWYKTKISEWGAVLKTFCEKEDYKIIKVCQSAGQERGQENTIQQQISDALEREVELTQNSQGSRVAGKMLVHEYLRWKPMPQPPLAEMPAYNEEYALKLYRVKGEEAYKSYLAMFNPPEIETNIPRLQIFLCESDEHDGHPNCCPIIFESLEACVYAAPKNDVPAEDVAEFNGDDPYDDLRYALDSVDNYVVEAQQEFEKVQHHERVVQQLAASNDWTAFYRGMQKNEIINRIRGVRRYHKGVH